jgi:hypothetical protein
VGDSVTFLWLSPVHGLHNLCYYVTWGLRPRLYAAACFAGSDLLTERSCRGPYRPCLSDTACIRLAVAHSATRAGVPKFHRRNGTTGTCGTGNLPVHGIVRPLRLSAGNRSDCLVQLPPANLPVRQWIAAERLRLTHIRLRFPNVTVQQVRVVARVTAGMQHADAKLHSRGRHEPESPDRRQLAHSSARS